MKPLLLVGRGSAALGSDAPGGAHALRTRQFLTALRSTGVPLRVLLLREGAGEPTRSVVPGAELEELDSPDELRARILDSRPRAAIAASTYASHLLATSGLDAPLWLDLNGDPMAEGQAQSQVAGDDAPHESAWWMLTSILRRGDRFSVVSRAQRFALLGQLGASGRLNRATAGEALVHVVPEACERIATPGRERPASGPFEVLFSGSFTSWVDGSTLARALSLAFAEEPALRFVVTGGGLPGFLGEAWRRFLDELARLPAERVELHGWVDAAELASIEERAGCGVAPELPSIERELGGQNRTLRWMARGIPVVTTTLSELGGELERAGAGVVYRPRDSHGLADAFVRLARDPELRRGLVTRAALWLSERRSVAATTGPLVEWASDPRLAGDRAAGTAERIARRHAEMLRDQLHLEDQRAPGDAAATPPRSGD